MTDITGPRAQAAQMFAAAALSERAAGFGATTLAMWTFYPHGQVTGSLRFEQDPPGREMDAWRLAIGTATRVHSVPSAAGHDVTDYWTFVSDGQRLELSVTRPAASMRPILGVRP